MSTTKLQSRSVYVAQLRRAFLLRAHPDRFRLQNASIRRGQAKILQALSERLGDQDFLDYKSNTVSSSISAKKTNMRDSLHQYVLEKRDGSLLQQSLQLNDSVENILNGMNKALQSCGAAASLPPHPPPAPTSLDLNKTTVVGPAGIHWASHPEHGSKKTYIDHQFDVNSTKGRNLWGFLESIRDGTEIEQRREARMDASAAALVARRLYSFQAIDGIQLGWSSASFAILLRSLIRLHEEHTTKFHVQSFYPLRLVFLPDCEDVEKQREGTYSALDLYGGHLYLNPASTPIQWLESLQEVTMSHLEEFQRNRSLVEQRKTVVSDFLGVKLKKGHTSSSEDYHFFLERLSRAIADKTTRTAHDSSSSALTVERLLVTVESPLHMRRPRVGKTGSISVHSAMSDEEVAQTIGRLSPRARDVTRQAEEERQLCREAIHQIQWELGLQKVYRTTWVNNEEFLAALSRLLEQRMNLKLWMAGHAVGIAGSGHFCHLSDDGSLMIPHNWT
jgi:hypothetical protein